MAFINSDLSTGLPKLDHILKGLMPGDNVVWHVNSIEDYRLFVEPYYKNSIQHGKKINYFRFAKHDPLIKNTDEANIFNINPDHGFENFIFEAHKIIKKNGSGAYYLFDCLSELASDWYSDQMLANFFMLTCPYIFDLEALAYFPLLKNKHSSIAISPIAETTQIFIDVYRYKENIYIHPVKVKQRYSSTIHMLHEWDKDDFHPVTKSELNAEILTSEPPLNYQSIENYYDPWNRYFREAELLINNNDQKKEDANRKKTVFEHLLRMAITRDKQILEICNKYFTLQDIVNIGKRMIGTGLIGGKSLGMLLSRAIIKENDIKWDDILEIHDSFYIGSDVFYTYLVRNGCWWAREQQKDLSHFLQHAEHARRLIHRGQFPEYIIKKFSDILNYFGQSPILVRSSSLLEDNFGNSFSGKYESVFCPNQGSHDKCLEDFITAVRTVYASTMSERTLKYRAQFGILNRDEQMSILVQRVSGSLNKNLFFPLIGGVAYSYNPYVWNKNINPEDGVIRIVFGMGTRAVDRTDDDYTRIAALNNPEMRPEENSEKVKKFSQKKVDVINLEANRLVSMNFEDVIKTSIDIPMDIIASRDIEIERYAAEHNIRNIFSWILTFEGLFKKTDFIDNIKHILKIIQNAYQYPVDVEFTVNYINDSKYKINIVQCRPFQFKGGNIIKDFNINLNIKDVIIKNSGPVIGQSRKTLIDKIIYITPAIYGELPISEKYTIARIIGKILNLNKKYENILLIGPGRWGTTTPSLGIPVSINEISRVTYLCEIVMMRENLVPDISLGTHFFNDLVELDILYFALYPDKKDTILNTDFMESMPNKISEILPDYKEYSNAITVIDTKELDDKRSISMYANCINQQVICYIKKKK